MKIFWFDTETAGLDETIHGIISLAYAVEIDGEFVAHDTIYSNPFGARPEYTHEALDINGFAVEGVREFAPSTALYAAMVDLLGKYVDRYQKDDELIIGGYNCGFDVRFLRDLWGQNDDKWFGSYFRNVYLDPYQLIGTLQYLGLYPMVKDYKLATVAEHFNIPIKAHDAMSDIKATIKIFRAMMDLIKEVGGAVERIQD